MRYLVKLLKTEEGYAVWYRALRGCCSQGETEAEALENIKIAIQEYIEVVNALVIQLIRDGIAQMQSMKRQAALDALDGLEELTSCLPLIDAVELIRLGRSELEQRGQSSQ